jgi:hypothetical protein
MTVKSPIIHEISLATRTFEKMVASQSMRNAFQKPQNLSIFTCHNHSKPTLFERNLDHLGVKNYDTLRLECTVWSNSLRARAFLKYLEEDCKTPYVLYCDADDVVLQKSPQDILDLFLRSDSEILYCSTDFLPGYLNMPDRFQWAEQLHPGRYVNSGGFIGLRDTAIDVYREVCKYVFDDDILGNADSQRCYQQEPEFLDGFPKGVGCDQTILRFIEPDFYPRMKLDADCQVFWRNPTPTWAQAFKKFLKSQMPAPLRVRLGTSQQPA